MLAALLLALLAQDPDPAGGPAAQPNILWLSFEDHGPQLGCYGDSYADTPVLDSLAAAGVRYERCWANAPVCSTARTTLITGRYATSLGAHHHRSRLACPPDVRFFPQLLRAAGYFCTNNRKEDYNLAKPRGTWDMSGNQAHWRHRAPGQPFFAVFNVTVSHESQIRRQPHELVHDPAAFTLPPYYPDLPAIRRDWAQEYDKGTEMDRRLGQILAELRADGLAEDTIILAFGDHGSGMPRHKRWPGDSGQRVPLLVVIPEKWQALRPAGYAPGAELDRLVSFVDFGPTMLSLAGLAPDAGMQGQAFLSPQSGPPKGVLFGYRGRMDEREDEVRALTDGRYVYLLSFDGARPHGAHVSYQFETPTTQAWFDYAQAHPEAPAAMRDYWCAPRGFEDLYDLQTDPHETVDLAEDPEHAAVRARLRAAMLSKLIETRDLGLIPEHLLAEQLADGTAAFRAAHLEAAWPFGSGSPTAHSGSGEPADPVLRWWRAVRLRAAARAGALPALERWTPDPDAGVAVLEATAILLDSPATGLQRQAWLALRDAASPAQPNYFVRLLAWQAIDEACAARRGKESGPAWNPAELRSRLAALDLTHPELDRAFANYLPRLQEKVLRDLREAGAAVPQADD